MLSLKIKFFKFFFSDAYILENILFTQIVGLIGIVLKFLLYKKICKLFDVALDFIAVEFYGKH